MSHVLWFYSTVTCVPVLAVSMYILCVVQVIAFFASKLEKKGPGPYSCMFVLDIIQAASKTWPRNSLRVRRRKKHLITGKRDPSIKKKKEGGGEREV